MEFHITGLPVSDVAVIDDALRAVDPAALVDLEGPTLRVATCLGSAELATILSSTGLAVRGDQIVQLPSICCGGCSG